MRLLRRRAPSAALLSFTFFTGSKVHILTLVGVVVLLPSPLCPLYITLSVFCTSKASNCTSKASKLGLQKQKDTDSQTQTQTQTQRERERET